MSQTVPVKLGERAYDIHIGEGALKRLPEIVASLNAAKTAAVITDRTVAELHLAPVREMLASAKLSVTECVVPPGETSKTMRQAEHLLSDLAKARLERKSLVIALGGGVVGDLAGFVAATYLRGVRFIQIPTTLLAMVDSSVGGKTGVNLPEGKNLVGCFHQPSAVLADLSLLKTLSAREFSAGIAEVIKYGIIRDKQFFHDLERNRAGLEVRDPAWMATVVKRCCQIKAEVVSEDEFETTGLREILNFGHTIGHGVENTQGYGRLLHGECVSLGMVAEARLAARKTGFGTDQTVRLKKLLEHFKLPVDVPQGDKGQLVRAMQRDKKVRDGRLRFALPVDMGEMAVGVEASEDEVKALL